MLYALLLMPEGYGQHIPVDELIGKFDPARHGDFSMINVSHTDKHEIYMRREAYQAFTEMAQAAKKNGLTLKIISATRSYDHQKAIWNGKWNRGANKSLNEADRVREILRYSSMPGTSRHHWGTDIDLNSLNNEWFASGEGKRLYTWLCEHAADYGFCQVYTSKSDGRKGYEEEKWHWSYLPIASIFEKEYLTNVEFGMLYGFEGWQAAKELNVFKEYVTGVATCDHTQRP